MTVVIRARDPEMMGSETSIVRAGDERGVSSAEGSDTIVVGVDFFIVCQ